MTFSSPVRNLGLETVQRVVEPAFPDADGVLGRGAAADCATHVDILLVNPPAPDRGIWIRSQHRVGRRSREGMIWPQVELAQMAALFPQRSVEIIDAIARRMSWDQFRRELQGKRPRYYVTQLAGPTLQNDMRGVCLAKSLGATTVAFGTHITPVPRTTMAAYPALDFGLCGEPELTLRELVDTLDWVEGHGGPQANGTLASTPPSGGCWSEPQRRFAQKLRKLFTAAEPGWQPIWATWEAGSPPAPQPDRGVCLAQVKGLAWRRGDRIVVNPHRPLMRDLDDLPLPRHDLLPLSCYRAPLVRGPYGFVVTSRGCPAGCEFCIKHVSYGRSVRFRSPENVLAEIEQLVALGVHDVHMYADLFTVNRGQVMGICRGIVDRGLKLRWTCNSRVDFVDPEMLDAMAGSGCWMISWGIESGDDDMLQRMHKGTTTAQAEQAVRWARAAGIKNWGYFVIGMPGETEGSIRRTIDFAKKLPLDLALFHIAAPHPGTPFFFRVIEEGWFRPGTRWEQVDMDRSTVLDYPTLRAEELERWARRAFREWALRPGPMWTYLKMLLASPSLWRPTLQIGWESMRWARSGAT